MDLRERIEHDFTLHPPTEPGVAVLLDDIRAAFKELALFVAESTPTCREQSLAVTELEQSLQWTIAAIVRNQG